MASTDVTVVCTLIERPAATAEHGDQAAECTFEVNEILKGESVLASVPGSSKPYRTLVRRCDRSVQPALDALIGCYLALTGESGLPLIEESFLKNAQVEYTAAYSAIMALRFIGQDTKAVSQRRLMEAFHHVLNARGKPASAFSRE